jgi:phosphatidate cytidylyltransferase
MLIGLAALMVLDHFGQVLTADRSFGAKGGIGGIGVAIMLWITMPIGTLELARLFTIENVRPYRFIAIAGTCSLIFHGWLTQFPAFQPVAASSMAFIIVGVMMFSALRRSLAKNAQEAIHAMAGTVLATLYLGGCSWFLMALRVKVSPHVTGSTWVVCMILFTVKFTDIGAYLGGRMFGRTQLIRWLSPKKTWEGLICGILLAGVVGSLFAPRISDLVWWKGAVFGAVIGGVGQAGDLLESMMKRDAEVKDSGAIIPGFGGMLDILDSPLLAAPFAYLLFSLL